MVNKINNAEAVMGLSNEVSFMGHYSANLPWFFERLVYTKQLF